MTDSMAINIARKQLKDFKTKLVTKNIQIDFSEECVNYIAKTGISEEFGAREIARILASKIKPLLVDEILFGKLSDGGKCTIDLLDETFKITIHNA